VISSSLARMLEDFNLPERVAEAADALPPEPTFSVSELAAARLEAWNDGYMAAAAADGNNRGRDEQRVFAELLARTEEIDQRLEQMIAQNATAIARWLVAAFTAALPSLSEGSKEGRIGAVMDLLGSALKSQSKIELRAAAGVTVSFHSMHDVCRQIETWQADEPTDGITIAWQQGEALIDPSRTWEEIRNAILPLAAAEPAETSVELRIT
jgi:hypothetical protein